MDSESEIRLRPLAPNRFARPISITSSKGSNSGPDETSIHSLHQELAFLFPDAWFSVVEYQGVPVGRCNVLYRPDFIQILDITIIHRYRRKGIGTHLVSRLIAAGATSGRRVIVLSPHSESTYPFYEKLGFKYVARDFEIPRLESSVGTIDRLVPENPQAASSPACHCLPSVSLCIGKDHFPGSDIFT